MPANPGVNASHRNNRAVNLQAAQALGIDVPATARPRRRGDRIGLHLLQCMSPNLADFVAKVFGGFRRIVIPFR
jgi:hypothetical protein